MSVHCRLPSSPSVPSGMAQCHAGANDLSSDGLLLSVVCQIMLSAGSCHISDGLVNAPQSWEIHSPLISTLENAIRDIGTGVPEMVTKMVSQGWASSMMMHATMLEV